ncbi:hypothetical protein GCM10010404_53980 [Nonomuraea africana]|uniref:Peptidase S1 domain-containing protein n=1 Tax=Nonomuraea africana TaxID=46171 RepID=A0ABR9K6A6_9ACTN|nr:trypsin-like serine protease [Nonomuraea africana]MBE1557325.1 hypothetical protein [Nonomuraea africana]
MPPTLLRRAALAGCLLTATLVAVPSPAAQAEPVPPVPVITEDPYAQATPPDYKLSYAFKEAERRAAAKPDAYAPPYISSGVIVAPVTTTEVQAEAGEPIALPPQMTPPEDGTGDPAEVVPPPEEKESVPPQAGIAAQSPPAEAGLSAADKSARESAAPTTGPGDTWTVQPKVKLVKYSLNRLTAIKDEVVAISPAELPGVEKVTAALVQAEHNRVIVESANASEDFRVALATRYGVDAVVVRQVPDEGLDGSQARWNDGSVGGFYGGARIDTSVGYCTNAFSWRYGGYQAMITAGHCTSLNGSVSTLVEYQGTVVKDTWNNRTGTVYIDGQSTYRGDLSLIRLAGGKTSAPRIYVGSSTSGSSRAVAGMWSRRPDYGDQYCTGGSTAGELCGWKVNALRINVRYSDGTYARNMTRGYKQGQCTRGGDSGGPIYTVNSAGKVVAKGVHSGGGGGGSDGWGGAFDPCREYFTDIYEAYYGFPGVIATG